MENFHWLFYDLLSLGYDGVNPRTKPKLQYAFKKYYFVSNLLNANKPLF